MSNYLEKDLNTLHDMLVKKEITPLDLVNESFERIEKDDLNCFININKDGAIKEAKNLTNPEEDNIFWGIPVALKDNIITKDIKTTAGSLMLKDFMPLYDAFVVELLKEKKMIIIGKLNMDEFAMGSSNQTSYFGPVKNPWNKNLVSGGSSGGAAAALGSNLIRFAIGSDTGGSIRQPSAFCGTVGLKPTYGLISRYGLIAFASSLDQMGPMTLNVLENAQFLNILTKKDENDLTQTGSVEDYTSLIGENIKGMRVAIPSFYVSDIIDSEIKEKFESVLKMLNSFGVETDIIDIKFLDYAVPLYQIIALGEASSNLARYDGIRYGYSSDSGSFKKTRSEGFGDEVKRRIMVGSFMLSGKNVSIYYDKALRIRKEIENSFSKVFEKYDLILGPTTTCFPYEIGEHLADPNRSFVDDILVIPANMAGIPSLSMPIGLSKNKLPIGMQIIANKFDEKTIYKFAAFVEKELSFDRGDINE